MDAISLGQSPFAVLTFIAAPAVLTNAASVLAMSTINRMLRTRDRMHQLLAQSEAGVQSPADAQRLIVQVNRVERQASLLLGALRSIYVALGAFAAATLVTQLGVVLEHWQGAGWLRWLAGFGLGLPIQIGVFAVTTAVLLAGARPALLAYLRRNLPAKHYARYA